MNSEQRQRPPEELAPEIWFYSLERRAQSTVLRRVTIALTVIAVVLAVAATAQPLAAAAAAAAIAAVVAIEAAAVARARRQRESILAQLQAGDNPQTVDAAGASFSNRSVLLVALAAAAVIGAIALLIVWPLT